jgi:hypothetical protein
LRSNLKPADPGRRVLFDEDPGFAALLNRGDGRAAIVPLRPFSGVLCLSITPPQRFNVKLSGWNFRIVEKPAAEGEFRYLRLAWRTAGTGVLLELAAAGKWPDAADPRRRFFAGRNSTAWQATEISAVVPSEWREEIIDLWKNAGDFTLTGIAPTAMGGPAFFDDIELLQSSPPPRVPKAK